MRLLILLRMIVLELGCDGYHYVVLKCIEFSYLFNLSFINFLLAFIISIALTVAVFPPI